MSDEYIRREDAVEAIGEEYAPRTDFERGMVSQMSCDKAKIKALPSADVVPVIRCKECMHYVQETPYRGYCTDTYSFGRYWRPDDFCSYGEREE